MNLRVEDPKVVNEIYQYADQRRQNSIVEETKAQLPHEEQEAKPYATPATVVHHQCGDEVILTPEVTAPAVKEMDMSNSQSI